MVLDRLWNTKNGDFAGEVLQKSAFETNDPEDVPQMRENTSETPQPAPKTIPRRLDYNFSLQRAT